MSDETQKNPPLGGAVPSPRRRSSAARSPRVTAAAFVLSAVVSASPSAFAQEASPPSDVVTTPDVHDTVEAADARGEPAPRFDTSGLALLGGLGTQYGSAGLTAAYYVLIGRGLANVPLQIAPFASLGRWVVEGTRGAFAPVAGLALVFGHRHRIYADVSFGPMRSQTLQLHGTIVDVRLLYGLETGIGWEYMAASGFTLRILPLGLAVGLDPRLPTGGHTAYYAPAVALGWKLW